MNKEEVEQFKRDLITAFENRTPNTTSLEIMRLLDRFEPDVAGKMRAEWTEQANPERAWADAKMQDFEFNNMGSVTVLLMELAEHHPSFAFTEEQWAQFRDIDDRAEVRGETRIFTYPKVPEDDEPSGMR